MAAAVVLGLFTIVGVELLARFWIRRRGEHYVFPPGLRLRLLVDREIFPELEPEVRFEINSLGERAAEPPRSVEGVYRVLYTGGSQPEAYMLDQRSTPTGALQRLLEGPAACHALGVSTVHVGSICRSGIGSEGLALILTRLLPRYPRLDLIVVHVGGSDVLRWLERGAPSSMPSPGISDVFRCHPEGPFGLTPGDCAAAELLRRTRRRWFRPVDVHHRAGRWYQDVRGMRARATTIITTMPDPRPMVDAFGFHLRRVLTAAQAHADRVIVVRQSWFDKEYTAAEAAHMWHGAVGEAWRETVTTYYSFDVVSGVMALLDERAAAVADELHVEHVDLMTVVGGSLAYYYDWTHFTPAGARTAAAAIARTILSGRRAAPSSDPLRPCVDLLAS